MNDLRSNGGRSLLTAALVAAAAAAVLGVLGAVLPVVDGAERGLSAALAVPMTAVLAALPVALAGAFAARGRPGVAVGVLVGAAALAPGRAVLDLQFAADPSRALRPELYVPTDLQAHEPAIGLWLLVAGHVVAAVAGLLAVRAREGAAVAEPVFGASASAGDISGPAGDTPDENDGRGVPDDGSTNRLTAVVLVAVVAAIGLLMQPMVSDDVYLLAQNAFEGPVVAMAGYLLLAAALPLAAAVAVSTNDRSGAAGTLYGLAAGGAAVAVPAVVSGLAADVVGVDVGPFVALAGLLGLVAAAALPARTRGAASDSAGAAVRLPGGTGMSVTTGALAVVTGVLAVVGALMPQLAVEADLAPPESPARWTLLAAGVLVGVLGLVIAAAPAVGTRVAVGVRPTLSVAWVSVLVAGTAVLDTAVTATGSAGGIASPGPGVVWTWSAMLLAAVTAVCSVITGAVQRDAELDTDTGATSTTSTTDTEGAQGAATRPSPVLLASLAGTGLLAVAAFAFPVLTASGYTAAGLWSRLGTPSWGLLAAVLVVLGALALVPRSRPAAAVGLLAGVGVVVALRAAALPLMRGELDAATAGMGFWFGFAALVAVVVTGMVAALGGPARR
ncbi:hypothetical protein BJF85_14980 [Saccharomonospora sp. CUA-673]|uniref:hypothetical protein n=1 Tax=Saccharomonospora sp. CUA-673 TaxID=1904969 RepID=UPI000969EFEC|nr:hypothetical protein [Saccharomonospora sp. CUA-673]OLT47696.1 hypothetical protein BJF85_14980 [Saccharomonospora sp. CUA-673]